ncbi:MAG: hypothetical protein S0880_06000 [Actinomycetota bacterium]|nr:hypothetical protein [Actinomycetota bacterium]
MDNRTPGTVARPDGPPTSATVPGGATVTESSLRAAGWAAVLSGVLFALIQVIHPENDASSLDTTAYTVAHVLSFLFPVLGIIGLTGIHARQIERAGRVGIVGYLLVFGAFVLMACFGFVEAFVNTAVHDEAPRYIDEFFGVLDGEPGPGRLGTIFQINGALFLLGGVTFALATIRARVLPRWPALVMIAGVALSLLATVNDLGAKLSAIVFGLGLAALGFTAARLRPAERR